MSRSGFFWNDKKNKFSIFCRAEIQKHEFQADYDRRSIQKLNEMIESQRGDIYRAHHGDEHLRRDQQLLVFCEMEELERFQGSTFDTIA